MNLSLSIASVRSQFRFPFSTFDHGRGFYKGHGIEVADILYYELSSIYHHLQIGTPLDLKWGIGPKDIPVAAVYYRTFKLGYLSLESLRAEERNLPQEKEIQVRVGAMVKKKYLPVEALFVNVFAKK